MPPQKMARYHHVSVAVRLLPHQDSTCLTLKLLLSPSSDTASGPSSAQLGLAACRKSLDLEV